MFVRLSDGIVINADNVDSIYEPTREMIGDMGEIYRPYIKRIVISTVNSSRVFPEDFECPIEQVLALIEENSGKYDMPDFVSCVYESDNRIQYINPSCANSFTENFIDYNEIESKCISRKQVNIESMNAALRNSKTLPHAKFIKVKAIHRDNLSYDRYINIAHIAEVSTGVHDGSLIVMRRNCCNVGFLSEVHIWSLDSVESVMENINAAKRM